MKSKIIKEDFGNLTKFIKGLESGLCVDVGIMGEKVQREENYMTNAEIGYIHEFGLGLPQRSFLRMPLQYKANQIVKDVVEAGALKKMAIGNVYGVMSDLGSACETAIAEAFDSGGFGTWPKDTPETMRRKKRKTILVETTQMADSITSKVVMP